MSYGMTYEQFWYGDPWLAFYYKQAYKERRKAENTRDWLLGAYFYNAVSTALYNGFSKRGTRKQNYLEEPFPIFPITKEEREEKERKAQEAGMAALRAMQRRQRAEKLALENNNADTHDIRTTDSPEDQSRDGEAEATG